MATESPVPLSEMMETEEQDEEATKTRPRSRYIAFIQVLGRHWYMHAYGFGTLAVVIATLAWLHFLYLLVNGRRRVRSCAYHMALALLVAAMFTDRAVYLFKDPYNADGYFPKLASFILYTGNPLACLTSAFYFLYVALLSLTKVKLLGGNIVRPSVIVLVVFLNFLFAVGTDIVVAYFSSLRWLFIVCDIYFIGWGIAYFIMFVVLYNKVHSAIYENKRQLSSISSKGSVRNPNPNESGKQGETKEKVPLVLKLTAIVAFLFLAHSGSTVAHLMDGFYEGFSAWGWLVHVSFWRFWEVMMAGIILLISALPVYKDVG